MVKEFVIQGRKIDQGKPCFIIAEAGVNHNGDLSIAHRLIDAAADGKADAVKFQTWLTEKLCKPGAVKADYQKSKLRKNEDQFTMLKKLEMPYAWHAELKAHAEERGIVFLSTPDEMDSARFLCELGVAAIKIGSGELTNLPFLRHLAGLKRPLILSTGMGDLDAVRRAAAAVRSVSDVPVALLHCVSAYPAPEEEMNLRCIETLRREFNVPVGLSDHTMSHLAALMGVGLKMAILEKHLTLDRALEGPDHAASLNPEELAGLVALVRKAETMMGNGFKKSMPSEMSTQTAVMRMLHYSANLAPGQVIGGDDLIALRCGQTGFPPEKESCVVGRRLRVAAVAGMLVGESDFE